MMPVDAGLWTLVIVPLRAFVPNALLSPPMPRPGRRYTFRAIAANGNQHGKRDMAVIMSMNPKPR